MSSNYHLMCLSHDPAIVLDCDLMLGGITSASRSHELLRDHQDCDIIAGRFSYPLIEAGCFGRQMTGATGCKGCHAGISWTDSDWLRLLNAAATPPGKVSDQVLNPFVTRCWPLDRLRRLRRELGLA